MAVPAAVTRTKCGLYLGSTPPYRFCQNHHYTWHIFAYVSGEHDFLHIRWLLLYSAYYSYSVYCLLEFIEEAGGMSAIHLHMVELEGNGQGCPQPTFAIATPHYHRIAELVGILIEDAVEFGSCHRRCAYHHRIIYERTLTGRAGRLRQNPIVLSELLQIICI